MTCVIEVTEKHSGIQSPNKKGENQRSLIHYILLLSYVVICNGILLRRNTLKYPVHNIVKVGNTECHRYHKDHYSFMVLFPKVPSSID